MSRPMTPNAPADKHFHELVAVTGKNNIDVERAIAEGASTVKDVLDKLNKEKGK